MVNIMRRSTLQSATTKISDDIVSCDLLPFFEKLMESRHSGQKEDDDNSVSAMKVFRDYSIATSNYSKEQHAICEILGIDSLQHTNFWDYLYKKNSALTAEVYNMYQNLKLAADTLPKILNLIRQDYVEEVKTQSADIPEQLKGKSLLTVIITEDDKQFSNPTRLVSTLNAISDLYSVVATIEKENENELIVMACDSGSDKSFDFLGLDKVIREVKEMIIAIWDRIVFHRHHQVNENLSLILDTLPIIEKIEELKNNKTIEKEQAELLKRKAISGVTQFIEVGAIIPELDTVSSHSPRQLMKPAAKLLALDDSEEPHKGESKKTKHELLANQEVSNKETSALSEDEAAMFEMLKEKIKNKSNDEPL